MGLSFKEYVLAVLKWWWVVAIGVLLPIAAVVLDAMGKLTTPTWAQITILLLGLSIAQFLAFHNVRVQKDKLTAELDDIHSARPNLELSGSPYVDKRQIMAITGMYAIGHPFFAHVKFKNDPEIRSVKTAAKNVVAEVTFFNNESKKILGPIYGRWSDTKQPGTQSPFDSIRDLCKVELEPNGLPRELDIALKYAEEEDCYAFNNESCLSSDWKIPQFLLKGDILQVHVRLVGENVEKEWWFVLHNEGLNKSMQIETMSPPSLNSESS